MHGRLPPPRRGVRRAGGPRPRTKRRSKKARSPRLPPKVPAPCSPPGNWLHLRPRFLVRLPAPGPLPVWPNPDPAARPRPGAGAGRAALAAVSPPAEWIPSRSLLERSRPSQAAHRLGTDCGAGGGAGGDADANWPPRRRRAAAEGSASRATCTTTTSRAATSSNAAAARGKRCRPDARAGLACEVDVTWFGQRSRCVRFGEFNSV